MSNLSQLLEEPKRSAVVAELVTFVDDTVAKQSGIAGMALKGAVSAAKKVDATIVTKGITMLLPDILGELESQWQEFEGSGESDFGTFLEPRAEQVTESVMAIADRRANHIEVTALAKAYNSLRGKAAKIMIPEIPDLARILQKHLV